MKSGERNYSGSNREPSLKGTLISVGVLGLVIVISWFAVFALFISR
ncbi:cytochrome c oxidase subunit 2A [Oceanobacillus damuensis]|nr:cytochrome c oxidase subunit 2A [Oceanobacillus damuensis]